MLIYFVIMKERMSKCVEACITWKIKSLSFIACLFFFFLKAIYCMRYMQIKKYFIYYIRYMQIKKYFIWVPISSTGKVSYGCIRNLSFNPRLHANKELLSRADVICWNSLKKKVFHYRMCYMKIKKKHFIYLL